MSYIKAHYLFLSITIYLSYSIQLISCVSGPTFQWSNNNNNNANIDAPQWQRSSSPQQQNGAVCVDIPTNVTLCQGIGYTKMRLPNLLNHDTLTEVSQQAQSWVPLSQLNCHPDTQLFLCSLFSPVCLDHPIPPCRSLCVSVQSSCEHVMLNYGYPWPKIVECGQFPIDNDMCIQAQHSAPAPPTVAAPGGQQLVADKKPIATNQHTENKHRKGDRHHNRKGGHHNNNQGKSGKKQRRMQTVEVPPGVPKETVYEPQPGHLQRSVQLDSQTPRLIDEPQVDQAMTAPTPATGAVDQRPPRKWSRDQRQLYNDIIANFCRSEWILKARLYPIVANRNELKVRNYRLIQGSLSPAAPGGASAPAVILSANRTIINKILNQTDDSSTGSVTSSTTDDNQPKQRRYFIIGRTEAGTGRHRVTYVMQWPHKSAQLRKAIKAITSGDYDCQRRDHSDSAAADGPDRTSNGNTSNGTDGTNTRDRTAGNNHRKNHRKSGGRVVPAMGCVQCTGADTKPPS